MIAYRTCKMCELNESILHRLLYLSNDSARGDYKDDGSGPGSMFRNRINEHLWGTLKFNPGSGWAILAYDGLDLVAWAMVVERTHDAGLQPFPVATAGTAYYVRTDRRRLGIATSLVQKASEVARKNAFDRLLANPWNKSSLTFFKANGFRVTAHYVTGEVCGVAFKELT